MSWEEIFPWAWATVGWAFAIWNGVQTKQMANRAKDALKGWRESVEREKALLRITEDGERP